MSEPKDYGEPNRGSQRHRRRADQPEAAVLGGSFDRGHLRARSVSYTDSRSGDLEARRCFLAAVNVNSAFRHRGP